MALNSLQQAFFGLPLLSVTIFVLHPNSFIRYALYPIPALLVLQAIFRPPTKANDVDETYLFGLFTTALGFRLFDYLYLQGYNTPKHFYRVQQVGKVKQRQEIPQHIGGRIGWAFLLLFSQRGIGWNFQVPVPETKYCKSKAAFIRQAVYCLLQIYLGLYLTSVSYDYVLGILRREISVAEFPWAYELCKNELFQMIIILVGWVITIISHISVLYNFAAIICVGLGIGGFWKDIDAWPRTFGRFRDAWSIRNMWGKTWHQALRRCLNAPGDKIADIVFGDPSQLSYSARLIRRYFLLFSAFGCSGILHAGGVYFVTVTNPMPHEDSVPLSARPSWFATGYFFYLQAVVITLEDFLCWVFNITTEEKEVQNSLIRWCFGTFYTLAWFTWSTTALWISPQLQSFGYQRTSEEGMGYVHVLEAISKSTIGLPLNPWPSAVDGALLLYKQLSKA